MASRPHPQHDGDVGIPLEKIFFCLTAVFGLLPLAGILRKRVVGERARGAHVRGAHARSSDSDDETDQGHAIRMAAASVISIVFFIARPHGPVEWAAIGVIVVVLLWEPVSWLTAYLVRKSKEQDAA